MGDDAKVILAGCSQGFQELHARIGGIVKHRFPGTRLVEAWDIAAWQAPISDPPPASSWKGTLPRDVFTVGPTEKKAGITVHVWHPNHPYLLKENEAMLKQAGFKVMVGCLQWNKKADFPIDALDQLLAKVA